MSYLTLKIQALQIAGLLSLTFLNYSLYFYLLHLTIYNNEV